MFNWLAKLAAARARQQSDALLEPAPQLADPNQPPAERLILGLDLGEVKDYTALVALQMTRQVREDSKKVRRLYLCGLICRWQLRTGYEAIIEEVRQIVSHLPAPPDLVVDGTGAGRAVVQMFRKAKLGVRSFIPVTITAGLKVHREPDGYWHVAKTELVSSLLSTAESGRLQIAADLSLASQLGKELRTFRKKVNARTRHESFDAMRSSDHDDIVMAAALAVWHGESMGSDLRNWPWYAGS